MKQKDSIDNLADLWGNLASIFCTDVTRNKSRLISNKILCRPHMGIAGTRMAVALIILIIPAIKTLEIIKVEIVEKD